MQTKAPLYIIAALASTLTAGWAQIIVNYEAAPGERNVIDALSAPLAPGNQVRVGYWSSGFDVTANAANLAALDSNWHPFSSTTVGLGANVPGYFSGTGSQPPAVTSFDNQKIYLWVFKTADASAPSVDLSNVQNYGIFSATSWTFPTQGSTPPSNQLGINSDQVNQAYWGNFIGAPGTGSLELASAVPEPQEYAMAIGLGLIGFAVWRQRSMRRVSVV